MVVFLVKIGWNKYQHFSTIDKYYKSKHNNDKDFIKRNFPNYEDVIKLDYRNLLLTIDRFLTTTGMDDNDDYNDLECEGQKVYDNIFQNN